MWNANNTTSLWLPRKMSENSNLNDNEFLFVPFRKRGKRIKSEQVANNSANFVSDEDIDKADIIRKIETAQEEISQSDLFSSTFASLREGLEILDNPKVKDIICLGLGHIGERLISRYQLALLLNIKNKFHVSVYVYDPIFYESEKDILHDLGFAVLNENLQGKYQIENNIPTIFYLPHCPKQLTNNLLWSNWSLNLSSCIIIANSFTEIVENTAKRSLSENAAQYIVNIFPYTVQLPIINTFKYHDIFNDSAIHIFPLNKLNRLPSEFWSDHDEPKYNNSDDVEFITNKFVNVVL